ncbi:hypothetical protein IJ768_00630 [Candidatus Saccharibacteria bacterium]|nr:hypothetical protein [Candidatus Saccharibacteria bacterium]
MKRRIILSAILGLFLSFLFYFGTKFMDATLSDRLVEYNITDLIIPLLICIPVAFFFYFFLEIKVKLKEDKSFKLKRWHIFIPLTIISIIMLLAYFPGHYPYDSFYMRWTYDNQNYTTHYSPLVSFLIGSFFSLGNALDSEHAGHAIMIVLQFLFVNLVMTEIIFYCSKKLKKKSFGILFAIFFMFHPLVQSLLIRSGQDTIFGGLFLLILLTLLKLSEGENFFDRKIKYVIFGLLIFLFCATRNNGIYALIPTIFFGIFALKDKNIRKKVFLTTLIPTIIFLGYNHFLIGNIVKSKDSFFQETINVPIMQIARAAHDHPDDESTRGELTEYFKEDCDAWINEKWSFEKYNRSAGISDPYKNCLIVEKVEENPLKFFDLWRRIGEKYPASYFEAPLVFTLGLYHPYLPYPAKEPGHEVPFEWHTYVDCFYITYEVYGLKTSSLIPNLQWFMFSIISEQKWSQVPVMHLLWGAPFTTFTLFLAYVFTFYRKKYQYFLPLSFCLGLFITVMLAPVMLFRYLFPLVITTPILFYVILKSWKTT